MLSPYSRMFPVLTNHFFRWLTTKAGFEHKSRRKWEPHHWRNPRRKDSQKWKPKTWNLVSTSKISFINLPRKHGRGITSTWKCLQSPWMHCLLWCHCRPSLLLWTRSPSLSWLQKQYQCFDLSNLSPEFWKFSTQKKQSSGKNDWSTQVKTVTDYS